MLDFTRHSIISQKSIIEFIPVKYLRILEYMQNDFDRWSPTTAKYKDYTAHEIFQNSQLFEFHIPLIHDDFVVYRRIKHPLLRIAVHRNAIIKSCEFNWENNVLIGADCTIFDNIYFGQNVTILDNTTVYQNSYIGEGTFIGNDSLIGSNTYIGNNNILKEKVIINEGHLPSKILDRIDVYRKYALVSFDAWFRTSMFHTIIDDQNFFDINCVIKPMVTIMSNNLFSLNCYVGSRSHIDIGNMFSQNIYLPRNFLVANYGCFKKFFRIKDKAFLSHTNGFEIYNGYFSYRECTIDSVDYRVKDRIFFQAGNLFSKIDSVFPRKKYKILFTT
ncbi:hypothetical protein EDEG_00143 [Edhazardia aedis USNM 41457]|uniref:Uncharacterized protein n=1 Tax=Edhazardia aedis (strain USNM 41457) TaxID=1003232 RepID=J8ZXE6_EDHAE|nr:hypothetical protein EDEG_00143 [Edhazardia aedis USNM 41457]|eukprot:EJW04358.1 hypothetical protein EDEG_00143 [Edhazardia aedis USNM 41457]